MYAIHPDRSTETYCNIFHTDIKQHKGTLREIMFIHEGSTKKKQTKKVSPNQISMSRYDAFIKLKCVQVTTFTLGKGMLNTSY